MSKEKHILRKIIAFAVAATMTLSPMSVFGASTDIVGHWAEKVITSWQDKGLIAGYEDGTFKPDNTITRAEFSQLLNQSLGLTEKATVTFSDVAESDWFYGAIAIAAGTGYTAGYDDGTFEPNEPITRADAADFVAYAMGLTGGDASKFTDAAEIPADVAASVGAVVASGIMSGRTDGSFDPNATLTRAETVSMLDRAMAKVIEPRAEEVASNDLLIETNNEKIADQTIEGNLVISEKVGDGQVYLKNLTIKGDLIVKGGGGNSVYLDGVTVAGKVDVDKAGVRLQLAGKTELPVVNINKACTLVENAMTGTVGDITIASAIEGKTTVGVVAKSLSIDAKAEVDVAGNIATIMVGKDAKDAKVIVESGVTVGKLSTDSAIQLGGTGKVSTMEVNSSGITVSNDTVIGSTNTAEGIDKPSKGTVTGGTGGTGNTDKTGDAVSSVELDTVVAPMTVGDKVTLMATIKPATASNKAVTWSSSDEKIVTISKTGEMVAVGVGEAVVTAKSNNNKTAICYVTVTGGEVVERSLTYDKKELNEASDNDGSIDDIITVTLTGDTFKGTSDGDITSNVTFSNVPSGLIGKVTKISDTTAEISFTGNATAHDAKNSITDLKVEFVDGAFTKGDASTVKDATKSDLKITFIDTEDIIAPTITFDAEQKATNTTKGTVKATSNEDGFVYIANSNTITTKEALDAAVTAGTGQKSSATKNSAATISTAGLAADTYYAYAVDEAGNVSSASTSTAKIAVQDDVTIYTTEFMVAGDTKVTITITGGGEFDSANGSDINNYILTGDVGIVSGSSTVSAAGAVATLTVESASGGDKLEIRIDAKAFADTGVLVETDDINAVRSAS